jgi:hypothetical protein
MKPRNRLVPIQPSTCACLCGWIQAGEMLSAARRPLIDTRFQTPKAADSAHQILHFPMRTPLEGDMGLR